MKSRGMKHSNKVREFVISDKGLNLIDLYLGPEGVLTGSAREKQQLAEKTVHVLRDNAIQRKDREISRKRTVLESRIASLKEEFESLQEEMNKSYIEEEIRKEVLEQNLREFTERTDHNQQL